MNRRRIFVGDIQGCREELEQLLDKLRFDESSDRLYSVGDVINRGPDSVGCLHLLRSLRTVMVLGNHEYHYLEVEAGRRRMKGRDTLESLLAAEDREELTRWLAEQPLLYVEPDVAMVHAGLSPSWSDLPKVSEVLRRRFREIRAGKRNAEDREVLFAMNVRHCDARGRRPPSDWPPPPPPFAPWDSFYTGRRVVVFGHWARRGIVTGGRVRGLDSGCVYGGALTAWIAEEERTFQIPARRTYCPR